jgi:TolB-like protein/Flp pilus assembly protein TadD
LPFENASGRPEDDYLSEGFSDELRDQLSRLPGLRVVARPSSIAFRGQNKPASAIAKELGVAMVVEGSLRKEGQSLHTVVRLVDATTDTQLWSESYDRNAHDTLGVQQEIAVAAAKQILPQIDPKEVPQPQWQPSVNDLMLLARNAAQNAVTPEDRDKAVALYQQVLTLDPKSAPAHARLARALLYQGQDLENAEKHARRSVQIDPKLAEGHAVLGLILDWQFRHGAAAEYARALELNPNDAEALHDYGEYLVLRKSGRIDQRELLRRASNLDPLSPFKAGDLATSHLLGGRAG